jgi:hypothetical protein
VNRKECKWASLVLATVFGCFLGAVIFGGIKSDAGDITSTGMYQKDLYTYLTNVQTVANELRTDHATFKTAVDNLKLFMQNRLMSDGAVAIGSTVAKVNLGAATVCMADGVLYTVPATNDYWTLSGTVIASGYANKYLLCANAAKTASIVEGTQALTAAAVTLPAAPASKTVIGILTVETTGVFTPGTTNLNAAHITDTYQDGYAPALIGDAPATLSASALSLTGL